VVWKTVWEEESKKYFLFVDKDGWYHTKYTFEFLLQDLSDLNPQFSNMKCQTIRSPTIA
jgi:hypothetical protein